MAEEMAVKVQRRKRAESATIKPPWRRTMRYWVEARATGSVNSGAFVFPKFKNSPTTPLTVEIDCHAVVVDVRPVVGEHVVVLKPYTRPEAGFLYFKIPTTNLFYRVGGKSCTKAFSKAP